MVKHRTASWWPSLCEFIPNLSAETGPFISCSPPPHLSVDQRFLICIFFSPADGTLTPNNFLGVLMLLLLLLDAFYLLWYAYSVHTVIAYIICYCCCCCCYYCYYYYFLLPFEMCSPVIMLWDQTQRADNQINYGLFCPLSIGEIGMELIFKSKSANKKKTHQKDF